MIPVGEKIRPAERADTPIPYKASIERVTLATMPTAETTADDRATRPPNGRPVATALDDQVPTVRVGRPDRVGSDPTQATRPDATRPDRGDPTEATRPDPTGKATEKPTKKRRRPDRDDPTQATRPRRPRRLGRLVRRRRKPTESVDEKARRAWLTDQGASVGIPRGYGWAFLALVVTTIVSAGSAFWFVFGNVTDTAAMAGVPYEQQRVVSPAIDVIVVGLTVYVQYLVMADGDPAIIRLTRRLLVGASVIMLLMNATPPVLAALTTDYAGPLMKATESFTPTFDQMTTGQLWGRAGMDVIITGSLVAWSHWGPRVFSGLAGIRARSDRAALREVDDRTFATVADRAEADRLRSEATALLEQARSEAAALVVSARSEATALLDQAGRDRAAAAAAARSATDTTAEADQARARAGREADATVTEARQEADRLRRQLERERAEVEQERQRLAGERAGLEGQAAAARAQLERSRDQLADDRRALEDLAAEVERDAAAVPPAPSSSKPPPRQANGAPAASTPRPPAQPAAGRARRPKEETIALGVAAWKEHHGAEWYRVQPIKKPDVMRICQTHSEMAMLIRGRLQAEADQVGQPASTESS